MKTKVFTGFSTLSQHSILSNVGKQIGVTVQRGVIQIPCYRANEEKSKKKHTQSEVLFFTVRAFGSTFENRMRMVKDNKNENRQRVKFV